MQTTEIYGKRKRNEASEWKPRWEKQERVPEIEESPGLNEAPDGNSSGASISSLYNKYNKIFQAEINRYLQEKKQQISADELEAKESGRNYEKI